MNTTEQQNEDRLDALLNGWRQPKVAPDFTASLLKNLPVQERPETSKVLAFPAIIGPGGVMGAAAVPDDRLDHREPLIGRVVCPAAETPHARETTPDLCHPRCSRHTQHVCKMCMAPGPTGVWVDWIHWFVVLLGCIWLGWIGRGLDRVDLV